MGTVSVGIAVTQPGNSDNGNATSTLTGDAVEFEAARAWGRQFFANVAKFDGKSVPLVSANITGLSPSDTYTFTFVASRMNSGNNLSGTYTVTGANTVAADYNPVTILRKTDTITTIQTRKNR